MPPGGDEQERGWQGGRAFFHHVNISRCSSIPDTRHITTVHSEIVTVAGQQYRKATWPRRIGARLIDILLLIIICTLAGESLLPLTFLLSVIYLFIGNALLRGASVGKRLTGLKIVETKHGGPCGVIQDLFRHRYLFFYNPIFLALSAYDSAQGYFDKPELYVVRTAPPIPEERAAQQEKPAKLDLAGMRATLQKMRDEDNNTNQDV